MNNGNRARWGALAIAAALWCTPAASATARQTGDGPVRLSEIVESYEKERAEFNARLRAAEGDERSRVLAAAPWAKYLEAFRECAYQSDGDTAAMAWVWVVRVGKEHLAEDAREAVDNLIAAHLDSSAIGELVNELSFPDALGAELAEEALARIKDECPNRNTAATAQYHLAALMMGEGDATEKRRARARELLVGLKTDYPNAPLSGKQIERSLYEIDHLQVGMKAPDFEAVDADGVAFKLSDYAGKVVVVDFWGFW